MTTKINLNGISELDFTNGIDSASTTNDVTTLTLKGTEIEVNGVDTTAQTPINFQSGTNITVSNPSAGNVKIDGPTTLPPSGSAGGDLSGTYPNPSVAQVNGAVVPASAGLLGSDASSKIIVAPLHFHYLLPYLTNFSAAVIAQTSITSTGDNAAGTLYTVPSGKRAIIELNAMNTQSNADTLQMEFQPSGSSQWVRSGPSVSSGTSNPAQISVPFSVQTIIYEAGDVISVNASAGHSVVWGTVYSFDDTSPLKTPRLIFSSASGIANAMVFPATTYTLYTVPNGKKALHVVGGVGGSNETQPSLQSYVASAISAQYFANIYRVPSGGSITGVNLVNVRRQCNSLTQLTQSPYGGLSAGDSLNFNTCSPMQIFFSAVANAAGGSTVYTMSSTTGAAANGWVGATVIFGGWNNTVNNGTFTVSASTATTLTVNNASGVAETKSVVGELTQTLTSVATGTGVYSFTANGVVGAGNLVGALVTVTGFTNAANNGTFPCTANAAGSMTLTNPSSVAETHTAQATVVGLNTANALVSQLFFIMVVEY